VALAAGGFTSAAVAHIFHRRKYEVLVRPALLTAMLGYTFAVIGLVADLGRYYNIWHPLWPTMWQGNSVLFEVAMCVTIYLNVLYIEFMPIVCERFIGRVSMPGPLKAFNRPVDALLRLVRGTLAKLMFFFIIGGVVLSCMHQSSLGSLMLIAPYKMSPLWYTPVMPLLFLLSAFAAGFAMVVFESLLSAWTFGRKPEMPVLSSYSRFMALFLGVYGVARFSDLLIRDAWNGAFAGDGTSLMFLAEIGLGLALPFAMLLSEKVRRSPAGLLTASSLVVGGVLLNRINVFLVAFKPPYAQATYFPSAPEILVTAGLVAGLVLAYRVCVTVFPVLPVEEHKTVGVTGTARQRHSEQAGSYVS
jgi:Ni/Fe-hydrogenase subunit HybB-like protein